MGNPGDLSESLTLTSVAADGTKFESESVEIFQFQHSLGMTFKVEARKATISMALEKPATYPMMRLWMRGFRSWVNPVVETPLGKIDVWGSEKSLPADEVSGSLALHTDPSVDPTAWSKEADAFLTFMWPVWHLHMAGSCSPRAQTTIFEDENAFVSGAKIRRVG
jgi:hypothetical protein